MTLSALLSYDRRRRRHHRRFPTSLNTYCIQSVVGGKTW